MALFITLGGDRLGSGKKQKVELHNYMMNSFNLEQDWKSTMAPGVLYPFIKLVGTPHGTFDIDLDSFVRTIPTRGPLFGSFKLQLDLFSIPFRLYNGYMHNNPSQETGLKMNQVYLPKIVYRTIDGHEAPRVAGSNIFNYQVNDSALLKYLGISGAGTSVSHYQHGSQDISRKFNAIPILAYYDIFKCYYSNKQEDKAYCIVPGNVQESNRIYRVIQGNEENPIEDISNYDSNTEFQLDINNNWSWYFNLFVEIPEGTTENELLENIEVQGETLNDLKNDGYISITINSIESNKKQITFTVYDSKKTDFLIVVASALGKINFTDTYTQKRLTSDIKIQSFKLANIDDMRYHLLSVNRLGSEVTIDAGMSGTDTVWGDDSGTDGTGYPYTAIVERTEEGISNSAFEMTGLMLKTYQSDLFNNWLSSEYVDMVSELTSVDTSNGSFTMDDLNLAEKFYELLNRIIAGGGTYQDWIDAAYGEGAVRMCETPMYLGGMSAEIMFEEVISNSETKIDGDRQPLGSLAGRGKSLGEKGGKNIHVKMDEPGYVMGIVSITPRICYSQGNDWDMTELDSIDDLHKPALDGIGFQPLMIEQFAWWNTAMDGSTILARSSAGKQTAWINYQTAVDKCFADFAKQDGYSFMVLNRNYERNGATGVKDITTYIDPAKYNYAFAYSDLAAQNFWVQIHSKVTARRKMGAQQIPNL